MFRILGIPTMKPLMMFGNHNDMLESCFTCELHLFLNKLKSVAGHDIGKHFLHCKRSSNFE